MAGGIRLLLDGHIHAGVAPALRDRDIDAIHARDEGLDEASDLGVMEAARSRRRVLVTRDAGDFMRLAEHRRAAGGDPPGLLLISHRFPLRSPEILVEALAEWVSSAEQMRLTVFRGNTWLRVSEEEDGGRRPTEEERPSYARALERVGAGQRKV